MDILMNLFDILGPVMVGPSSSHTAGAVRIGYVGAILLQEKPIRADITLHGSFATTGKGHGTDKALIAGLIGMRPDDIRIPDSFELAGKEGLEFAFHTGVIKDAHPNTALLELTGADGKTLKVQASSIGGGRIMIDKLDGTEVHFSAEKPTLIVNNLDKPGYVAEVTNHLAKSGINIATMQLYRGRRGGDAIMTIELDHSVPTQAVEWLRKLPGILKVVYVEGVA